MRNLSSSQLVELRFVLVALFSLLGLSARAARPDNVLTTTAETSLEFPNQIEFTLHAESDIAIETATLEYGIDLKACATDVTRVVPEDFEAPQSPPYVVDTKWVWDMRQTGSLPPGARLWWRWQLTLADGSSDLTNKTWLTWIDDDHNWQILSKQGVNLHWYAGREELAQQLLEAAVSSLSTLDEEVGAGLSDEVNLFIYGDVEAMRDSVLFEPQWTGGQAYYEHNIVILGINQQNIDWGVDAIAHEMAHLVVHNVVNHCYSRIPTWIDEGLAVYAQGGPNAASQETLAAAFADDSLYSVRALSDGFGEHPAAATVSYAQSYSLVAYLIEMYGREKMLELLLAFQDGYRYESALQQVYGLTVEGLEAEWREENGAAPRPELAALLDLTATSLPTFEPFSIAPVAATVTPLPMSLPPAPTDLPPSTANSTRNIAVAFISCLCLFILAFAAMAVLGIVISRRRSQ